MTNLISKRAHAARSCILAFTLIAAGALSAAPEPRPAGDVAVYLLRQIERAENLAKELADNSGLPYLDIQAQLGAASLFEQTYSLSVQLASARATYRALKEHRPNAADSEAALAVLAGIAPLELELTRTAVDLPSLAADPTVPRREIARRADVCYLLLRRIFQQSRALFALFPDAGRASGPR